MMKNYLTNEIGSKGYIDSHNANKFKSILKLLNPNVKYFNQTVRKIRFNTSKIAVLCSFAIFYAKYNAIWREPAFLCKQDYLHTLPLA